MGFIERPLNVNSVNAEVVIAAPRAAGACSSPTTALTACALRLLRGVSGLILLSSLALLCKLCSIGLLLSDRLRIRRLLLLIRNDRLKFEYKFPLAWFPFAVELDRKLPSVKFVFPAVAILVNLLAFEQNADVRLAWIKVVSAAVDCELN